VEQRYPRTDYFFHASVDDWRGFSSPYDDHQPSRNFRRLSRELCAEVARERVKEAIVFALVTVTAAWPVIYMVVMVVRLTRQLQP
jgi:hypothetical protein